MLVRIKQLNNLYTLVLVRIKLLNNLRTLVLVRIKPLDNLYTLVLVRHMLEDAQEGNTGSIARGIGEEGVPKAGGDREAAGILGKEEDREKVLEDIDRGIGRFVQA